MRHAYTHTHVFCLGNTQKFVNKNGLGGRLAQPCPGIQILPSMRTSCSCTYSGTLYEQQLKTLCVGSCNCMEIWGKTGFISFKIEGVNLSQNAVLKKILKILHAVKTSGLTNLHIVFDYPKMPRLSKKANLVKELEAVIQVRTLRHICGFTLMH